MFKVMFVLACEILIGNLKPFTMVHNVRIEKSWMELGNKCFIELPSLLERLKDNITAGTPVKVTLWYEGLTRNVEFEGFVRRVSPRIPFEVECEDNTYLLRKTTVVKSWNGTTLKEAVQYLVDEVNNKQGSQLTLYADIPHVRFEKLTFNRVNGAQALQKLKEEYGLTSYFRGNELFCGLAYQQNPGLVKYSFAWNIIENDLVERHEEDFEIRVKAIGITRDNKRVEVEVGDKTGEERTIFKYNVTDKAALEKIAIEEMQKLKFTGFEGSISTFLYPYAEPLMTADLQDPQYEGRRAGRYIIDSVKTSFGVDGARREVELGKKVSV